MVNQTSYYTLSELVTACTVIFVNGRDRAVILMPIRFYDHFWHAKLRENQLQHSVIVMVVTLSIRLHIEL